MKMQTVCAVVVTYNRLYLLIECINSLKSQDDGLDEIIVVNNGSTDGTKDWLASQTGLTVIEQKNLGSAGGQNAGVKAAYLNGHDWIWCMDDDTIPLKNALVAFKSCRYFEDGTAGFLASRIIYEDNKDQPLSFPIDDPKEWFGDVSNSHCISTQMATFVSVMFNRKAIQSVGFPCSDFFIIWDDSEFTKRVSGWGKSWHVLDSIAVHKTPDRGAPGNSTKSLKLRYHQRNRVYFVRLQKISLINKIFRISKFVIRDLWLVIFLKITLGDFVWTLNGIFSPLKIEKPS